MTGKKRVKYPLPPKPKPTVRHKNKKKSNDRKKVNSLLDRVYDYE